MQEDAQQIFFRVERPNQAKEKKRRQWRRKGMATENRQCRDKLKKEPRMIELQLDMFQNSTAYILEDFNSICCQDDRIYNLMKYRPKNHKARTVKCKCEKSKCEARYCECYSNGQVCGDQCECRNCLNADEAIHSGNKSMKSQGCKCSKSECIKNYCECFQKGDKCSSQCRCANCRNLI